jgi:WS/DGAT/MGAT family acyltransferase
MTLLDGLEDGRWALATKTHHCLVDGIGSLDIGHVLLDTTPDAPPLPPTPLPTPAEETEGHGNGRFWLTPGLVLHGARAGLDAALHPRQSLDKMRAAAELIVRDDVIPAPKTSLNQQLSSTRHFAAVRFDLADIKDAKNELGGTVNDIVLALCTGGLRDLLLARGETVPDTLRAQVPVNIRTEDTAHTLGNELTSLFVELPVGVAEPLARYNRVVRRAEELKSGSQQRGGKTIVDLADMGPPLAGQMLARSMFGGTRMFNLTITNVPGPQQQLYAFGAPLVEVLPLVPLFAGHAVGIAVVSFAGHVVFGLNADRLAMPDVAVLAEGIERSFDELRPRRAKRSHQQRRHTTVGGTT